MDKNGPGEYLTMNSRHFLLSCNPFWWSGNFLDTIGPSRSVCTVRVKHFDLKQQESNKIERYLTRDSLNVSFMVHKSHNWHWDAILSAGA